MAHRAVIDECNFKNIADLAMQNRGHVLPVEGPHVDGYAGGYLAVDLLHLQGDLADGLAVHLRGGVQRRDVRVAVLVAAAGRRRHVNLAVRDRHEGRDITRRGVVVVGVVTGSHLLRRSTGHLHLEDHAQGAVARHGAVRFGIGGHDAGVHALRLAGVDRAGGCTVIEGQVVGHALILVGDLDDQAVTGGHLHLGGGEAVVAGCLHLHGGGLSGRRDRLRAGVQGGQGREVQRGGVHREAQQEGHGHGQGSLEALLGVRDGLGGERLLGEGGLLTAGAGRHHLLAGAHRSLHTANHERNERGQGQGTHDGDGNLNGLAHRRAGHHEDEQGQVHGGHAGRRETVKFLIGCAHHRRAATHALRKQVAHRAEQHLKQEANHEDGGHGAHIQLREGGGRHHDDGRHNAHQEPAEAHTHAHGRVLVRALGAQGANHHPGHEQQAQQVHHEAGHGHRAQPEERTDQGQRNATAHEVQGAHAVGKRPIHHLGAQHGRPEGHQRANHRDANESEHVHGLVGEQKLRVQGAVQARVGHHRAEQGAQGQQQSRNDVETNCHAKAGGQGAAYLTHQVDAVPGHHRTDDEGTNHRAGVQARHAQLANHAYHEKHDARVQGEDAAHLDLALLVGNLDLHERFGEVLRPNQNRVRNQAEGHHVHHQPAAIGDDAMQQKRGDEGKHPVGDGLGGATMPRAAAGCAARNLFGGEGSAGNAGRAHADAQPGGAASGDGRTVCRTVC